MYAYAAFRMTSLGFIRMVFPKAWAGIRKNERVGHSIYLFVAFGSPNMENEHAQPALVGTREA